MDTDFWKIHSNIGAIAEEHSLSTRAGMMFGPVALLTFRPSSNICTPCLVMTMSGTVGKLLDPRLGMLLRSSFVKTDLNWLFKAVDFSSAVAANPVADLRAATPKRC